METIAPYAALEEAVVNTANRKFGGDYAATEYYYRQAASRSTGWLRNELTVSAEIAQALKEEQRNVY